MLDVLTLGELLIDFSPVVIPSRSDVLLQMNAGGAPANVAVQLARLGLKTSFIGKVGKDKFGQFLKQKLETNHVCTSNLILDPNFDTTLAFVTLNEDGERDFTFFRRPGADTQLQFEEVDLQLIDDCKIFHFGSLSLTTEPCRSTLLKTLEYAKEKNKIISYDPNWRPLLWSSEQYGIDSMRLGLEFCQILKVSEEELKLITQTKNIQTGIAQLVGMGIPLIIVTLGADGSIVVFKNQIKKIPTYKTNVIDTTGAGDSFFGAFLYQIIRANRLLLDLSIEEITYFAQFANAAGAICTSKMGAIPAMPSEAEIIHCMNNIPRMA